MGFEQALHAAGFNILDMEPEAAVLDFFTDAPERTTVREVTRAEADAITEGAPRPDLASVLAPLCGGAKLAFMAKGRSAEVALVEALGLQQPRIVTHGLFSTTARALARCGATFDNVATIAGSSNVDLDQLAHRLGDNTLVWLEVANNGISGWPIELANVAAVRELCDARGVRLVLDATRLLTNSALGGGDARTMLALADAFTISWAKEWLAPGAICGARDPELIGRANAFALTVGTGLDRTAAQVAFAAGYRYLVEHPGIVEARNAKTRHLAELLVQRGLVVTHGGHAVFVELGVVMRGFDVPQLFSLLSHLFALSGVRAQILPRGERPTVLRLALPLERFTTAELEAAAEGVAQFVATIDRAPMLHAAAGQDHLAPLHRRYEPA